jgi:hypothetical protein
MHPRSGRDNEELYKMKPGFLKVPVPNNLGVISIYFLYFYLKILAKTGKPTVIMLWKVNQM